MSTNVAKKSLKDCIRHFTPAWFAAIMGTGSISILFNNSPYARDSPTMEALTYFFFFLNLVLFVIFNALTLARYIMFPDIWSMMIHHPIQSLFIGAYPMGLSTLINIAVGFLYERKGFGGQGFLYAMWGLWWFDVVLSVACAFELVHIMKTRHEHSLNRMTANWLLPVVTLIVISSTGGIFADPLATLAPSHALLTLTVSLVLVSMGLGLAMMILTMYFLRLIVHGVPPSSSVLSVFIPLGPMAQGGYSILLLGQGFRDVLPLNYGSSHVLREAHVADMIATLSLVVALVLWSLATMWMIYAVLAVIEVLQQTRFPFKQAFWGLIFPNGVYANLTIQLYRTVDAGFFRVWGAIYALATLVLWAAVFFRTATLVHHGVIFESPCLEDFDMACAGGPRKRQTSVEMGDMKGVASPLESEATASVHEMGSVRTMEGVGNSNLTINMDSGATSGSVFNGGAGQA
ncbi:voltage-dependent anion channel-domain-containing protein [Cubamyces lactineus]|nr:voltage-dependent anion channel-domain-containing protein [Cubamyces lactineus]